VSHRVVGKETCDGTEFGHAQTDSSR